MASLNRILRLVLSLLPDSADQGQGTTRGRRVALFASVFLLATAAFVGAVSANGSVRLVVIDEVAGPYQLRVGVLPGNPIAGPLHLSIRIVEAEGGAEVHDAAVRISANGPGTVSRGEAVNSPQTPQLYEGNLWLDALGDWTISLEIDGAPGAATHTFDVRASNESRFNLMFVIVAVAAALLVASLLWSQIQRRRRLRSGRR